MNGSHKWVARVKTVITAKPVANAMVQIGVGVAKRVHWRGDTKLYSPLS